MPSLTWGLYPIPDLGIRYSAIHVHQNHKTEVANLFGKVYFHVKEEPQCRWTVSDCHGLWERSRSNKPF